jgi:hypothetical protein
VYGEPAGEPQPFPANALCRHCDEQRVIACAAFSGRRTNPKNSVFFKYGTDLIVCTPSDQAITLDWPQLAASGADTL